MQKCVLLSILQKNKDFLIIYLFIYLTLNTCFLIYSHDGKTLH